MFLRNYCANTKLQMRVFSLVLSVLLALTAFAVGGINVRALSEEEIGAPSAVLIEPVTGKVLFEKNSHEIRPCASITKVMTLILVFEAIEDGKLSYDDIITSSAHAASMGGSDIWLEAGETMTVHEMIKAVVVASANDAAVALAEAVAGTEDEFVSRMNERAKELSMFDTTFKNCNGLDEEGHLTSAYDVALMSAELIKHEKIFEYSSIWLDYLRGGDTQIVNTNKLLKTYKGITGLKTGTTSQAGSCMSATAERDGLSLVAVVLGCDTGTGRFSDAAKLLDYGFANFRTESLSVPEESVLPLKIKGGMSPEVYVKCNPEKSVVLPKGNSELKVTFERAEELEAPVSEGEIVGKVIYTLDGATVDETDIVTVSESEKMSFKELFLLLLSKIFSL